MTTAHKPTWNSAVGSSAQGGSLRGVVSQQISSKNLNSHTTLNYRKPGQGGVEETKNKSFREELEEKEREARVKKRKDHPEVDEQARQESDRKKLKPNEQFNPLDKDDTDSSGESESDSESDSEQAELMREYEKITREREAEQKRLEAEKKAASLESKSQSILRGNPLLNPDKDDFNIKKKWFDDVVFKHQSRSEPEKKQRFINDTTRNDFHRKFLSKYIK